MATNADIQKQEQPDSFLDKNQPVGHRISDARSDMEVNLLYNIYVVEINC